MTVGGTHTKVTRNIIGMTKTPAIAGSMVIGGMALGMAGFSPAGFRLGLLLAVEIAHF
jgi:hypothetical protein